MGRSIVGILLAVFAAAILFLGWGEVFSPLAHTSFGIVQAPGPAGATVVRVKPGSSADKAGIRVGDGVDLSALSSSDRVRLRDGSPAGTTLAVTMLRGTSRRVVTLQAREDRPALPPFFAFTLLATATITLIIVALIALRRPSLATAALVLYGAGTVTTGGVMAELSWIPNPWFGGVAAALATMLATLPVIALLPFIVRFPRLPTTPAARLRMHVADGLFILGAVLCLIEAVYEPVLFSSWATLDNLGMGAYLLLILIFATAAYRDTAGEDRRRIGWVIAGFIVSTVAYTAFNVGELTLQSTPQGVYLLGIFNLGWCALPIALAYAVLRHRVLDLGFALNRTAVYAVMTTLAVLVVSCVDWLTLRLLSERRLALAIEAVVTIAFGFALNTIHSRTERLIDRIVFRQRHLAEKRIQYRIGALGFAASSAAVDEALSEDAAQILDLASAAIFARHSPAAPFRRTASLGWPAESADALDEEALIVRTLRSLERPTFLDDVAIVLSNVPQGPAHPTLAVPIVAQHELIGIVLYGQHADGASLDPEEVSLLARLTAAGGNAYGAVEVRHWRERAATLQAAAPA